MKNKIMNFQRKIFLIVWIPIVILVTIGMIGNIGREMWFNVAEKNADGIEIGYYWVHGIVTTGDVLVYWSVMILLSLLLFIIVGIEPKEMDETRRAKLGKIFMCGLWSFIGVSLLIIIYSVLVY